MEKEVSKRVEKEMETKSKEVALAKESAAKKVEEAQKEAANQIEKKFAVEEAKTKDAFQTILNAKVSNMANTGNQSGSCADSGLHMIS